MLIQKSTGMDMPPFQLWFVWFVCFFLGLIQASDNMEGAVKKQDVANSLHIVIKVHDPLLFFVTPDKFLSIPLTQPLFKSLFLKY